MQEKIMTTTLAAALLRDAIISGMRIATETPIEQVPAAIADVLAALSRALDPALRAERDETYAYAKRLAEAMFANGKFDAPQWKPLEDTLGVLTQIDNMVAGIRARAEAAEAREERLRGALGQLRKNATGQWVPSSVVTAIIDAALTETATTEEQK